MMLGGFSRVMRRIEMMGVRDVRVMRGFLVMPGCVVLLGFFMMMGRVFVMFRRFLMMFDRRMLSHWNSLLRIAPPSSGRGDVTLHCLANGAMFGERPGELRRFEDNTL